MLVCSTYFVLLIQYLVESILKKYYGAWPQPRILSCAVVAWSTRRGWSVPRVYTERSDRPRGDLELVCGDNEAVLYRERGPGIHITPFVFRRASRASKIKEVSTWGNIP